jgi:cysteine desulfuration protein SufE
MSSEQRLRARKIPPLASTPPLRGEAADTVFALSVLVRADGGRDNGCMNALPSTADVQQEITDEFAFFSDWSERYQYLIDLGKQLPPFPEEARNEANRVHGCQSMVWLVASGDAARMHFESVSDSAIVSGLIALLLRVYSDRSAQEILATEPTFIQSIGLARHLSPTRSNGLAATLAKLKELAARALA